MQAPAFRTYQINAPGTQSLCWVGDTLVDWVDGGTVLHLDGTVEPAHMRYAYRFDAAVSSPCGDYAVIYERLGTTGLVLHKGEVLRQINRDFYHADDYEYPVAIFRNPAGRTVLAHCPESYCQLELEDIHTGERLGGTATREPTDFFHSRLRVSPDGRWLASAGWVWHPFEAVNVYDLEAAAHDARTLDRPLEFEGFEAFSREVVAADFLPDNRLVVALDRGWDEDTRQAIESDALALLDPVHQVLVSCIEAQSATGTLMPLSPHATMAFCGHPKLLSLLDGTELVAWKQLNSGNQISSILRQAELPPLALDPGKARFAVASPEFVTVIEFIAPGDHD